MIMRKLTGRVLQVALAMIGLCLLGGTADAACTVYEHADFRGRSRTIDANQSVPWLGRGWNDIISSVRTSRNCTLRVYEHRDLGGRSAEFQTTSFVGRGWNDRISALECECTGRGEGHGREGFCRDYARRAVRAQETNKDLDCGFTGPRWHSDYDNHFSWCLNAPRERAESETQDRRDRLESCRAGDRNGGRDGYCQAYARRAISAQRVNMELGCGYSGPRWHRSRERHYEWCLNAPREAAERESQARRSQLERCRR
jgi:hypothetical protein